MDIFTLNLYYSCMQREPSEAGILNFNLFGESADLPDVVHCEPISARSTLHNWEFARHRHARLHQVLLIQAGGGQAELDGEIFDLSPSTVVNVPADCVHAFSFHGGTQGWVVTLGQEILDETLKESEGVKNAFFKAHVFINTSNINVLMKSISQEHTGRNFARALVLRSMSGQLIGNVAREILANGNKQINMSDTPLKQQFEMLVDEKYLEHLSVTDYAEMLNVTSGHLTRTLRRSSGLSASRVIEIRLVREARRYLAYTNITISEIAYKLGFIDPAYFSRVFSRSTGSSPRSFRQKLDHNAGVSRKRSEPARQIS